MILSIVWEYEDSIDKKYFTVYYGGKMDKITDILTTISSTEDATVESLIEQVRPLAEQYEEEVGNKETTIASLRAELDKTKEDLNKSKDDYLSLSKRINDKLFKGSTDPLLEDEPDPEPTYKTFDELVGNDYRY